MKPRKIGKEVSVRQRFFLLFVAMGLLPEKKEVFMNFKKMLFICILLLPPALSAGIFSDARLGFQQGYLLSRLDFSWDLSPYSIADMQRAQGGIFLSLQLGDHFAIQPELSFTQKGVHVRSGGQLIPPHEETWRFEFIEFPLSVHFYPLGKNRGVIPSFFAGPFAAARIGMRVTDNGREVGDVPSSLAHSFDLGMMAGMALAAKTGTGHLHCELRYSHGLSNFMEDPWYGSHPESTTIKTRSLALLFGYSLPLGKNWE